MGRQSRYSSDAQRGIIREGSIGSVRLGNVQPNQQGSFPRFNTVYGGSQRCPGYRL